MGKSTLLFSVFACILLNIFSVNSEDNFCGLSKPDPGKTCISIRLPWQANPIYFCTEKETVDYYQQCPQNAHHFCPKVWNEKSLLIATPWDCCPMISLPNIIEDVCKQAVCPPKPLNRTCQEIKEPNECCSKYFCEPNTPNGNCNFKLLEPECGMVPKDKTNCIAFKDPYGCCDKYQCAGEGKPGTCPNSHIHHHPLPIPFTNQYFQKLVTHAKNFVNSTFNLRSRNSEVAHAKVYGGTSAPSTGAGGFFVYQKYASGYPEHGNFNQLNSIPCVGDYNCPGKMKCCASVAMPVHEIHAQFMGNPELARERKANTIAMNGFCTNPINLPNTQSETIAPENREEVVEQVSE